jgi:hypothetical protein
MHISVLCVLSCFIRPMHRLLLLLLYIYFYMARICTYTVLGSNDTTEAVKCKSFIWTTGVRFLTRSAFFRPLVEIGSGAPFMVSNECIYILLRVKQPQRET